jgi:hypothetical protein
MTATKRTTRATALAAVVLVATTWWSAPAHATEFVAGTCPVLEMRATISANSLHFWTPEPMVCVIAKFPVVTDGNIPTSSLSPALTGVPFDCTQVNAAGSMNINVADGNFGFEGIDARVSIADSAVTLEFHNVGIPIPQMGHIIGVGTFAQSERLADICDSFPATVTWTGVIVFEDPTL